MSTILKQDLSDWNDAAHTYDTTVWGPLKHTAAQLLSDHSADPPTTMIAKPTGFDTPSSPPPIP